jgi:crotonobetainyl-CoA:carnitine CoA-transferase CaiB-like acyl-CoA transferase/enterochelin esterase-like enzyme
VTGTLLTTSAYSATLGTSIDYTIYLPDGYSTGSGQYPVMYLMHGRGGSMADWARVAPRLDELIAGGVVAPLIAVMPDAPWSDRGSWYVDSAHVDGALVETALTGDLVRAVDAAWRTVPSREGRLVGGVSMGGAGALRFVLGHPELFHAALLLSPAVYSPLPPESSNTRRFGAFGVGDQLFSDEQYRSLGYLSQLAERSAGLPIRLFVAAGDTEVGAATEALVLYNALRAQPDISASLRIVPGGHDWGTWLSGLVQGLTALVPSSRPPAPLAGVRVVELATLFAGPLAAAFLGDVGASVVKVEHPAKPDPARGHGPSKDGVGLWWKVLGRNKQTMTLDLGHPDGASLLRRLVADADVLVENFRPGTLERWGIGPDVLLADNPRLVVARVSGFGQFGPYARRPGFGTLAEAMSGFAAATGEPDGPPTLPPFGLADSIAALATAYAVMLALRADRGQVLDVAIIEPIMAMLGPQITWYDQLGYVQPRTGNRSANNAPRNTYRCADGSWVAVSTSAQSIAERVMRLVGRPDVVTLDWFATGSGRAAHADELDAAVGAWIGARTRDEVLSAFEAAQAAVGPVYDVRDVFADPQFAALGTITKLDDPELGPLRMQNVPFRLSSTPGAIRFAGRPHGADTSEVLSSLGLSASEIASLRARGVV